MKAGKYVLSFYLNEEVLPDTPLVTSTHVTVTMDDPIQWGAHWKLYTFRKSDGVIVGRDYPEDSYGLITEN